MPLPPSVRACVCECVRESVWGGRDKRDYVCLCVHTGMHKFLGDDKHMYSSVNKKKPPDPTNTRKHVSTRPVPLRLILPCPRPQSPCSQWALLLSSKLWGCARLRGARPSRGSSRTFALGHTICCSREYAKSRCLGWWQQYVKSREMSESISWLIKLPVVYSLWTSSHTIYSSKDDDILNVTTTHSHTRAHSLSLTQTHTHTQKRSRTHTHVPHDTLRRVWI